MPDRRQQCPLCGYVAYVTRGVWRCSECGFLIDDETRIWTSGTLASLRPAVVWIGSAVLALLTAVIFLDSAVGSDAAGKTASQWIAFFLTVVALAVIMVLGIRQLGRQAMLVAIGPEGLLVRKRAQSHMVPWNNMQKMEVRSGTVVVTYGDSHRRLSLAPAVHSQAECKSLLDAMAARQRTASAVAAALASRYPTGSPE